MVAVVNSTENKAILKNGSVLTPFTTLKEHAVFINNGKIEKIVSQDELDSYEKSYINRYKIVDVKGHFISPGFIDIHTHGANGVDAVRDAVGPMADFKIKHGTTGFLPTLWTTDFEKMVAACSRICDSIEKNTRGSRILGINSEGPYLNPLLGAQEKKHVKIPKEKEYSRLIEASRGNLKIMTVAPELEGSVELISFLRENNVIVSIGHSDLAPEKLRELINSGGIRLVTHILNALGESEAYNKGTKPYGLQEELLICDELKAEVMCDAEGTHVHPTWINILLRCKGIENLTLITDSMNMTGLSTGPYSLQDGRKAVLSQDSDIVRLENGVIAGSVMTMNRTVRNMLKYTNIKLEEAVRMASYNPAEVLGIDNKKGKISAGMDADIIVFDTKLNVLFAMVEGNACFNRL